jgi:CBS domain-containing protein
LGGGKVGLVLPQTTVAEARDKVEQLRNALAETARDGEASARTTLTISAGLAELSPGDNDVRGWLKRTREVLRLASRNGGDCVVVSGEFDEEQPRWQAVLERGNPFADSQARDVMTPLTAALDPEEPVSQAAQLFQRTDLPMLPVVKEGNLLGILTASECQRQIVRQPDSRAVDIMTADFVCVPGDADYHRAIMQHFLSDDRPAIIFEEGLPRGFVNLQSFVSIVASVRTDTFGDFRGEEGCRGLLVPDRPRMGARGAGTAGGVPTNRPENDSADTAVEALATS